MTVLQSSFLFTLFSALWRRFAALWDESAVHRLCLRLGRWIREKVQGSVLCDFVWRSGSLPRQWTESLSRRLFNGLLNLPCAIVRRVYQIGRNLWDGSAAFRCLSALSGHTYLFLGLLALVMLIAPHSLWNNVYGFLSAVAVAALFIFGSAARPERRLDADLFGPYTLFYLLCVGGALAFSLSTSLSLRFFLFHAAAFLLALMAVNSVERLEQLRLTVWLAVAGIAVAAVYGCYQGYVGVEVVASLQDMSVNKGMPGRVYSLFDNPNNFAELLVMLIPLDIGLLLSAKGWRERLCCLGVLVPCVASIGLTYSRSGWIGLALAVCVMIALLNWKLVPVMAVLGVCAIPFLPSTIYNRILTIGNTQDSSTRYRFAIYEATGNLMRDYWVRGVGLGTDVLKKAFADYPTMFDGNSPIHTHNNYLEVWCEMGIAGFLSYLAMLLYTLKSGVKSYYASKNRRLRCLLAAAVGAFCGILVIGIAEYTWFYPRNMFIYWFLLGVILACVKLVRQERSV